MVLVMANKQKCQHDHVKTQGKYIKNTLTLLGFEIETPISAELKSIHGYKITMRLIKIKIG